MNDTSTTIYQLEQHTRFSESIIWQVQEEYYGGQGVGAWKFSSVPHYITTNPTIARIYAEIALGFFRDWRDRQRPDSDNDNVLYFVELGAGNGRFAYYFIKIFADMYQRAGFDGQNAPRFCYVLTDLSPHNVTFWQQHPRFQPFIEQGVIDFAQYDTTKNEPLHLLASGRNLDANSTSQPIIAIGNYFFDSIGQDLFHVRDGKIYDCRTNVTSDVDPETTNILERIWKMDVTYSYEPVTLPYYDIPELDNLLSIYQQTLSDAHVYIPHTGILCLKHLSTLTTGGLMLLVGDKGAHRLDELEGNEAPRIVRHGGAFSLNVNFHALATVFEQQGGWACFPDHNHYALKIAAYLSAPDADQYNETQFAYHRMVNTFGTDEFYVLKTHFQRSHKLLPIRHLIAYFRLSHFDPQFIIDSRFHLQKIAGDIEPEERAEFFTVIQKTWELYFYIEEPDDFAFDLALMLYDMAYYETALLLFQHSINTYGVTPATLYNIAVCYCQLGNGQSMHKVIDHLLQLDPTYMDQVLELQEQYRKKLANR